MKRSEDFKRTYSVLKDTIITDIWSLIKDQDAENGIEGKELDISSGHEIVTQVIDDQESEVIHKLEVRDNEVIALSGVYEDDREYNLEEFEVPMLIAIMDAVEKILE